ncbi:DUF4013 domain-containing protein [Methanotorris formicicus]|uniref:Glycerophosphoryl diester phosphodiesterase membrane domain-containing protein n=1 Tax=Methanotorris formicicus Mc-S-70 TaxID=647171 RepID=H1KZ37_9EURY|nr:DUF4013 domain-containing protein [Methanotorris formicicus]EHP86462.1 hypothetical protein MetfoDRAFT_1060 [Methanotorris formicicus Mc-S-70]
MFFEDYIIEPLKYALSDTKKLFVGGVLSLVGMVSILFGVFLVILGIMPTIMPEDIIHLKVFGMTGVILGGAFSLIGFLCLLAISGYYMQIIKYTLEDKNELPEWENFLHMVKKGFLYAVGISILTILINIPSYLFTLVSAYNDSLIVSIIGDVISIICSLIAWLIIPLATVNFVAKDRFFAFFYFREIIKMMSFEYVGVLFAIVVMSFVIVILYILGLVAFTVVFWFVNKLLMIVIIAISILVFPFIDIFIRVFSNRAYAKYYKNLYHSQNDGENQKELK